MKTLRSNEGFTIIELLVAINIALISITFIVSFYLFTAKFISSTSSKLDWKQNKDAVLFFISQALSKSGGFTIKQVNKEIIISTLEGRDIIIDKNKISLDRQFLLSGFDDSRFDIELKDGRFIKIINIDNSGHGLNNPGNISSDEIREIQFEIIKGQETYAFSYYVPRISGLQFQNIR